MLYTITITNQFALQNRIIAIAETASAISTTLKNIRTFKLQLYERDHEAQKLMLLAIVETI